MQQILKSIIVFLLTCEARLVLRRHQPYIIAVTGSVGKTTTKDAIFHVLEKTTKARKSEKSFNSEIGIPLTILGLSNAWGSPLGWAKNLLCGLWSIFSWEAYPEVLVLEVGADHPGDIKRAMTWITPDVAVVTRLPERPVHVENFHSPESVRSEKAELVLALKTSGVFVGNGDDPLVRQLSALTKAKMITYGFSDAVDVRGREPLVRYDATSERGSTPLGMTLTILCKGKEFPVNLTDSIGTASLGAILAALAVGSVRELDMETMIASLATLESAPGRMRIIAGVKGSVLIDDSYNSSPVAVESALQTLKDMKGKRKIALLGDMLELGRFAEEEHRKIGETVAGVADELLTVGARANWIAESAMHAGLAPEFIHRFANSAFAGEWMLQHVNSGDVMLFKGSQGSGENMIRMERAVKLLMARPEDAKSLLVRQEPEWQRQYRR